MKTIFIRCLGLSISAMIMAVHPFAQQKADLENVTAYKVEERLLSFPTNKNIPLDQDNKRPDYQKAINHFNKMFFGMSDVKWSLADNGSFFNAAFTKEGFLNSVFFDKNGNEIYLINYVTEKQLPEEIKDLVTNNFDEFKITSVYKVSHFDRTIWVVKLASYQHIVLARVENGEIEEVEKYNRAE